MRIYKILDKQDWAGLRKTGRFAGSVKDLADGYIHFSTAQQVRGTAARHYAGRGDLVLLEIDAELLGDGLRWEPSRDGQIFPHLYGVLEEEAVLLSRPLPWLDTVHGFPDGL
jgi:uncharacterized protein (DUF952 family)